MKTLEVTITTPKFTSVNSMYEPNIIRIRGGGTRFIGMRLSGEARAQKEFIKTELMKSNFKDQLGEMDPNYPMELTLVYVLKENLGKRDLNNFHKCVIDAIFEYLGINDNRISHEEYYRLGNSQKSDYEFLKIRVGQMDKTWKELIV